MDTQLKQRLTGAIILVVLAVLVVPELLTGPPQSTAMRPSSGESAPIRSYTIDLTGAAPPRVTREPGPAGDTAPMAPAPLPAPASTPTSTAPARAAAPVPAPLAAPQQPLGGAPTVSNAGFAIQLGSFANRDTASRLARELQAAGFRVSIAPVRAGGRELQRVRVGPVADRAAAEALLARLTAAGHKGPIVPFP